VAERSPSWWAPPRQRGWLGTDSEQARSCIDASCLSQVAQTLKVEHVMVAQWRPAGDDLAVRLFLYTRGTSTVLREQFLVKQMNLDSLKARAEQGLNKLFETVRNSQGILVVQTNVSTAKITLNGRLLGVGSVEKSLPGGVHQLKVIAPGSAPYEQEVLLGRGAKRTLRIVLQHDERPGLFTGSNEAFAQFPVAPTAPEKPWQLPAVFKHPGLYAVAGGVAVAAIGAVFGAQARSSQSRFVDADGNGRLDLTRAQALAAQQRATLANVFLAAGLTAVAGGGAWLYFAPVQAPSSALVYPTMGMQGGVGGTF